MSSFGGISTALPIDQKSLQWMKPVDFRNFTDDQICQVFFMCGVHLLDSLENPYTQNKSVAIVSSSKTYIFPLNPMYLAPPASQVVPFAAVCPAYQAIANAGSLGLGTPVFQSRIYRLPERELKDFPRCARIYKWECKYENAYSLTLMSSNIRTRSSLSNLHPSPLSSSKIRSAAPSMPPGIPSVSKLSTIQIC